MGLFILGHLRINMNNAFIKSNPQNYMVYFFLFDFLIYM
jgi:hypothetical protein